MFNPRSEGGCGLLVRFLPDEICYLVRLIKSLFKARSSCIISKHIIDLNTFFRIFSLPKNIFTFISMLTTCILKTQKKTHIMLISGLYVVYVVALVVCFDMV